MISQTKMSTISKVENKWQINMKYTYFDKQSMIINMLFLP